jgi:plasmid stabilization system protein ParE
LSVHIEEGFQQAERGESINGAQARRDIGAPITPLAKADIFRFWAHIAEDREAAADRVEHGIFDACGFIAEAPARSRTRADLTTRPLRSGHSAIQLLRCEPARALQLEIGEFGPGCLTLGNLYLRRARRYKSS